MNYSNESEVINILSATAETRPVAGWNAATEGRRFQQKLSQDEDELEFKTQINQHVRSGKVAAEQKELELHEARKIRSSTASALFPVLPAADAAYASQYSSTIPPHQSQALANYPNQLEPARGMSFN
ncbi:hypothetical protein KOW79_017721 [Hemibagrus wyckioides]|uniref:Uncharacterized protein n=1 Tax=Hemibagrus wyckioides TaxID=337641 RepID=A0A9D3NE66_9TELE|nr:hypothetical protein KOW79_017721 [Hemibagrus wyckioides]